MNYSYTLHNDALVRTITTKTGAIYKSSISASDLSEINHLSANSDYELLWLQCQRKPVSSEKNGEIRVIDLFCGCGGLTLGIEEACRALEYKFTSILGADLSPAALELYKRNFMPQNTISDPIELFIDQELGEPLSEHEQQFINMVGDVDILLGGPPCQGNSDLNNHTRRSDPRNLLYLRMIRCVEILRPKYVLIENVPGVQHDQHSVVSTAKDTLCKLGYYVDSGTINMAEIGVPQNRKRFFLIAALEKPISLQNAIDEHRIPTRDIGWAINDLLNVEENTIFDTPARSSDINMRRIDYLFDHDIYDLPNSERPDCHRLKKHSYTAVYGRMHWDRPSPTITGGFGSNGQGRFVHPLRRRTITPHEAARIQFFPDYFSFENVKRRELQQIIGNAVPSKASYIIGIEFLKNMEVE